MNIPNLIRLAEVLESPAAEDHFNMQWFLDIREALADMPLAQVMQNCGSTACIGGWAAVLAKPEGTERRLQPEAAAEEWLGLNDEQAKALFYPSQAKGQEAFNEKYGYSAYDAGPKQAAFVVRNLAATGEVDWSNA